MKIFIFIAFYSVPSSRHIQADLAHLFSAFIIPAPLSFHNQILQKDIQKSCRSSSKCPAPVFTISPTTQTVLFCYYHMYHRLRDSKLLHSLSHRSIIRGDTIGNPDCTFLNILFQKETSQNTILHCMKCCEEFYHLLNLLSNLT